MADKSVRIEVHGLKELVAAFRVLDPDLNKALKAGFRPIAEMIAARIRAKVPGRAKAAIGVSATQKGAGISFVGGGGREPLDFYPWLDFGGSTGKGHQIGKAWSGSVIREWMGIPGGSGRYVYPGIAESRDEIGHEVEIVIERVASGAQFEVRN